MVTELHVTLYLQTLGIRILKFQKIENKILDIANIIYYNCLKIQNVILVCVCLPLVEHGRTDFRVNRQTKLRQCPNTGGTTRCSGEIVRQDDRECPEHWRHGDIGCQLSWCSSPFKTGIDSIPM
jgi:hypothetical protein